MGTRSTIALEFADGTVEQVYCHWDGYLSHNGKILQEHYSDPFKLRDLIDLGYISSLGKEVGEKHPFGPAYNEQDPVKKAAVQAEIDAADEAGWTTVYARDRGEDLTKDKFASFTNYKRLHQREEYAYILRTDGKWYVAIGEGSFIELASAFEQEKEAA